MEIWAVGDGGAGFSAQVRGLSKAIAALVGGAVAEKQISRSRLLHLLPALVFARGWRQHPLAATAVPELAVLCGSRAAPAAIALRRRGTFVVFVQKPPFAAHHFDLVVAPAHDQVKGENVIETMGAVGEVSMEDLRQRQAAAQRRFAHIPAPRIGVLVGGANRAFSFSISAAQRLADELKSAAQEVGGGILLTVSRRTGKEQAEVLKRTLGSEGNFFWGGGEDNPYMDILAAADFLIVTGDSVNMLSEACSASKPVLIWAPSRRCFAARSAAKFFALHESLIAHGLARLWPGELRSWESPPLAETARAAEAVLARFKAQKNKARRAWM